MAIHVHEGYYEDVAVEVDVARIRQGQIYHQESLENRIESEVKHSTDQGLSLLGASSDYAEFAAFLAASFLAEIPAASFPAASFVAELLAAFVAGLPAGLLAEALADAGDAD